MSERIGKKGGIYANIEGNELINTKDLFLSMKKKPDLFKDRALSL